MSGRKFGRVLVLFTIVAGLAGTATANDFVVRYPTLIYRRPDNPGIHFHLLAEQERPRYGFQHATISRDSDIPESRATSRDRWVEPHQSTLGRAILLRR